MGLLAKQATKRRVQPAIGPSAVPGNDLGLWRTNGRIIADAIIRRAALIADVGGKQSDPNRGRTNMIASAILSTSTIMWIETVNTSVWRISLGSTDPEGEMAVDWQCEITHGPREVQVQTPQYLTVDGELKHGKLHDEFRTAVLAGLALGTTGPRTEEATLSRASLESARVTEAVGPIGECHDTFRFLTTKSLERVAYFIGELGFPKLEASENSWRFGLGLPRSWSGNWVELACEDQGDKRALNGAVTLSGIGSRMQQLMAAHAASALYRRLRMFLSHEESGITITAPSSIPGV